jgi:3alpha(or 20beta)-hydroxysteroid dehydrogenase
MVGAVGELDGKVAIITGAARGQGATEAHLFAARGARVVVTDVLADEVKGVAADIGDAAVAEPHDVTNEDDWARVVARAVDVFGGLDVLVNNAGIHWIRPITEESRADLDRMLSINLVGPFVGIQAVVEPMRARGGGSIVNVSSYAGLRGAYGHGAYGASKWGLRGLTKTAAVELGPLGIRVNSVHPGPIVTDMLPVPRSELAGRFGDVPLQRAGEAGEVAELVAFLASDASSYLSGSEIAIDGGLDAGRVPKHAR